MGRLLPQGPARRNADSRPSAAHEPSAVEPRPPALPSSSVFPLLSPRACFAAGLAREALPPCLARGRRFSMPQLYAAVVSTARPRSQGRAVEDVPPVCGVRRSFDEGVPGHLHRR